MSGGIGTNHKEVGNGKRRGGLRKDESFQFQGLAVRCGQATERARARVRVRVREQEQESKSGRARERQRDWEEVFNWGQSCQWLGMETSDWEVERVGWGEREEREGLVRGI